jgi:hypothetical protein
VFPNEKERSVITKLLCKMTGILALSLAVSAAASAQYGGNPTMGGGTPTTGNSTNYGYGSNTGKAIGIGVGAAAAAVGVALLVRHHHKAQSSETSLVGCTQSLMNGLSLTSDNDHLTYTLLPGKGDLQPGERVELKGTVAKDQGGSPTFRVRQVVTNYGACGATSAANLK